MIEPLLIDAEESGKKPATNAGTTKGDDDDSDDDDDDEQDNYHGRHGAAETGESKMSEEELEQFESEQELIAKLVEISEQRCRLTIGSFFSTANF